MAQSRKHRSKREVLLKTARVINKGGGGGEKRGRTMSLEQSQDRKRMMKDSQHLSRVNKKEEGTREDRIERITKRVTSGKGRLKVVRR